MKQKQFIFQDDKTLYQEMEKIRAWYDENLFYGMLIQIYTEIPDKNRIEHVLRTVEDFMPEAAYLGCSSNGNIVNGDFSGNSFAVICTCIEFPTTKVELLQYELTADTQARAAGQLADEIEKRDWVKGVMLLATIRNMSMTVLCEELSKVKEGVHIFGGGAFSENLDDNAACVFSEVKGFQEHGIVFVLLGGPDLYIETSFVSGWKPLGSFLNVTSADGHYLKELNNRPAYDTYYKYLHIKNDESFFHNTLEFPFLYRYNGIDIMRAPIASNPDGSLTMTSDMNQDVKARLAYGDPWTILESTREEGIRLSDFVPECIFVFSCAARRTFWGNNDVGKETAIYQEIAPTSGLYTSGEFLRTGGYVNQHNVTQILAALREGIPDKSSKKVIPRPDHKYVGKVSMITRLATFIKATTGELEEANRMLSTMAITDALTGLLNRGEIQRRITCEIDEKKSENIFLIMLDLDDFKKVNDTYGHKEGDNVLIRVSGMLKETLVDLGNGCCAGRWGGEEFMVLLPGCKKDRVLGHAERIRRIMDGIQFEKAGRVTVSVGVTQAHKDDTADSTCIRVDKALYIAKSNGKNQVQYL